MRPACQQACSQAYPGRLGRHCHLSWTFVWCVLKAPGTLEAHREGHCVGKSSSCVPLHCTACAHSCASAESTIRYRAGALTSKAVHEAELLCGCSCRGGGRRCTGAGLHLSAALGGLGSLCLGRPLLGHSCCRCRAAACASALVSAMTNEGFCSRQPRAPERYSSEAECWISSGVLRQHGRSCRG